MLLHHRFCYNPKKSAWMKLLVNITVLTPGEVTQCLATSDIPVLGERFHRQWESLWIGMDLFYLEWSSDCYRSRVGPDGPRGP